MTVAARAATVKPFAVKVPRLNTGKFRVTPVGLRKDGSLAMGRSVTRGYTWKVDDAAITAHTDHDGPALFNRLHTLKPGDRVVIYQGGKKVFKVKKVIVAKSIPMDKIYDDDADRWLVTCHRPSYRNGHYKKQTAVRLVPA